MSLSPIEILAKSTERERVSFVRQAATRIFDGACSLFLYGSFLAGGSRVTALSDIDLLIVPECPTRATRGVIAVDGVPVDHFIVDIETLNDLIANVGIRGSLAYVDMVANGECIQRGGSRIDVVRGLSREVWRHIESRSTSYEADRVSLTNALHDFVATKDRAEAVSTACHMYLAACGLTARSLGVFHAKPSAIPIHLRSLAPQELAALLRGLEEFLAHGDRESLANGVRKALARVGGELSIGYTQDLPFRHRMAVFNAPIEPATCGRQISPQSIMPP